jgi:hypothetical protein
MCKQPAESAPSPKTRAKKQCQKSSARGNFKTAPFGSIKKITNARVLLPANDVFMHFYHSFHGLALVPWFHRFQALSHI